MSKKPALNVCQTKANNNLANWYLDSTEQCAILQGEAGSGKTFLIKHFLQQFSKIRPMLIAETNEAVSVLLQSTDFMYPAGTVCNVLCLSVSHDKEHKVLKQYAEPDVSDYNLLIVDEASMLDQFKIDLLLQLHTKILFVGHKSQLPPVDVNLSQTDKCVSPVFKMDFPTYELKTIERHGGELLEFVQSSERCIYNNDTLDTSFSSTHTAFNAQLKQEDFVQNIFSGDAVILAYTNAVVAEYNAKIREAIFGKQSFEEEYLPSDKILLKSPALIFTNPLVKLRQLSQVFAKKCKSAQLATNTKCFILQVNKVELLDIPCYELIVTTNHWQDDKLSGYLYVPECEESFKTFCEKKYKAALYSRGAEADKLWADYHNITMLFADARHLYARTIHTAQGSTIPNVIVDDADINKCKNIFLRKKLRYVAYSRAGKSLQRLLF